MTVRVRLEPLGADIETEAGTPLRDVLFAYGVEFPCGGRGACRGCRVRVLSGASEPTDDDRRLIATDALARGWRLACRATVTPGLSLEVEQWASAILSDDRPLAVSRREGAGVAVDVGTTTLVAQLVDLADARVLGVRTAVNPQAALGADVMSRIAAALEPGGATRLGDDVRREVGRLVAELVASTGCVPHRIVLVGNTVMHHLFCGLDVSPLASAPFESPHLGTVALDAVRLGWSEVVGAEVRFLPCVGGFVGSDVVAGVRAVGLHEQEELEVFVDLGTNAEVVVGSNARVLCASTAAGPAFEGGRISQGMRAATGAICEVAIGPHGLECRVLGGGRPRGLCGSGLVDAVRCALDLGRLLPSGRLADAHPSWPVCGEVTLTQGDVRQLQLAKAAIAAGIATLTARLGAAASDIRRVHLAGAFGNYVDRASAHRIGLLPVDPARVHPAGNTALAGAKLALFDDGPAIGGGIHERLVHVPLGADPGFADAYVGAMRFPER